MSKNRGGVRSSHLILLTGTIDSNAFVYEINDERKINISLNDTKERLRQYESAISRYITQSVFTEIVFVENSGYPFPVVKYNEFAQRNGKKFEFLYRALTEEEVCLMLKKGKSWGEADLIDYAISNSELIKGHEVIYKCTGRIFLKNSKKIVNDGTESEFAKSLTDDWANTYFFKLNINDYYKYLQGSLHLMDDYHHQSIEFVWCKKMIESDMKVKCFKKYPRVNGVCASINAPYDKPRWKYFLMDLYIFFGGKKIRVKKNKK